LIVLIIVFGSDGGKTAGIVGFVSSCFKIVCVRVVLGVVISPDIFTKGGGESRRFNRCGVDVLGPLVAENVIIAKKADVKNTCIFFSLILTINF
jgi:hypothetical protein